MDTDDSSMPTGSMVAPFLVPCFVQPNAFHSLTLFEDRRLPTQDEYALYASEDSTLVDVRSLAAVYDSRARFKHLLTLCCSLDGFNR